MTAPLFPLLLLLHAPAPAEPPSAPESAAPEAAPPESPPLESAPIDPGDAPKEVVIRTDPLDTPPPSQPATVPEPQAPPTTDHYGIPSSSAGKQEFPKRPAPPQPVPSQAAAQRETAVRLDEEGKVRTKRPGSPQRFALEVKLGPYLPNVDRRYDGPGLGPYATIYGRTNNLGVATRKPKQGIMPALAFEWQFLYLGGPLAIGTQVAFFRDKADALLVTPNDDGSVRSAADSTTFGMVPLALQLNYRFEYLADRLNIPLVPYAKGGLAYAFWWTKDGNGDVSRNRQGEKGSGGVLGWQVNAGAMLRLDFIEPTAAKNFDKHSGINHTYVFGEFQLSRVANFGVGNSIALGDGTWFGGLAIEF